MYQSNKAYTKAFDRTMKIVIHIGSITRILVFSNESIRSENVCTFFFIMLLVVLPTDMQVFCSQVDVSELVVVYFLLVLSLKYLYLGRSKDCQ